jgi:hypothetical protein
VQVERGLEDLAADWLRTTVTCVKR